MLAGPMIQVLLATSADDVEAARELFVEYQRTIDVDLCFQNFEKELAALPGDYAAPSGRLLLAKSNGDVAGCVALRRLSETTCEMKRLFVRAAFQGQGVGKKLVTRLIEEARGIGYSAMRLDTLPTMKPARALYESLGFRPIPPYTSNPVPGTAYLELRLSGTNP